MFGAIDEDQTLGFPVAGKNAAANVRYELKFIFQLIKKQNIQLYYLRLYLGNETVLFSPVMVTINKGWANFFKF